MSKEEQLESMYAIRKYIEDTVEWNFGVCPQCEHFDAKLDELRNIEFSVKTLYPEEYKSYSDKYY